MQSDYLSLKYFYFFLATQTKYVYILYFFVLFFYLLFLAPVLQ